MESGDGASAGREVEGLKLNESGTKSYNFEAAPVLYNCTLYCRTGGNCCRILDFGKKLTALKRNSA